MKKAQQISLVQVILFFFVLIILIAGAIRINAAIKKSNEVEYCRLNVAAAEKIKDVVYVDALGKYCPAKFVEIKADGLPKDAEKRNAAVKQAIANEMQNCWYKFGAGELQDFHSIFGFDKTACFICSRIAFDSKLSSQMKSVDNMEQYLKDTKIPGKENSYYDYLTQRNEKAVAYPFFYDSATKPAQSLDTSKSYYLWFIGFPEKPSWMNIDSSEHVAIAMVPEEASDKIGCEKIYN